MTKKITYFLSSIGVLFTTFAFVYADTLISYIPGNQEALPGPYNMSISTMGSNDLRFLNLDNDASYIGDYFSGYYYDPILGYFQIDSNAIDRVRIISELSVNPCDNISTFDGYRLGGHSYSANFGLMNFNYSPSIYAYICIPKKSSDDSLNAYFGGFAYSELIGYQRFDKNSATESISFDASVDAAIDDAERREHNSGSRYIKVTGLTVSDRYKEAFDGQQYDGDVKIVGQVTKATLRADLQKKVFNLSRYLNDVGETFNGEQIDNLSYDTFVDHSSGIKLFGDTVLYFGGLSGQNITLQGATDLSGAKTIIVEGGNVEISENIVNSTGDGILGIIALQRTDSEGVVHGGNIYVHPYVTDLHAIMYTDRALISYDGTEELDGSTQAYDLRHQLYIHGSLMSENTIGGYTRDGLSSGNFGCPYFIDPANCDADTARKYDLNFLRRYALVEDIDTGDQVAQFDSLLDPVRIADANGKSDSFTEFPLIIDYNSALQQSPPPFFR